MRLIDAARVIRSKNAGPTTLTIDLMFNDKSSYQRAVNAPSLSAKTLAELYGLEISEVEVIPYDVAFAIKIAMVRKVIAGDPGDRDVYGAQQHGPLLLLDI